MAPSWRLARLSQAQVVSLAMPYLVHRRRAIRLLERSCSTYPHLRPFTFGLSTFGLDRLHPLRKSQ